MATKRAEEGCPGICVKHKYKRRLKYDEDGHTVGRVSPYKDGARYCQACEIFLNWQGKNCPCCNERLRWEEEPIVAS